jgi:hypothetical protein
MDPQDLGDDPQVAASILAEDLGVDPDSEFVVTDEIDGGYTAELFRGVLVDCLTKMEELEGKGCLTIMEAELFDEVRRSVN